MRSLLDARSFYKSIKDKILLLLFALGLSMNLLPQLNSLKKMNGAYEEIYYVKKLDGGNIERDLIGGYRT